MTTAIKAALCLSAAAAALLAGVACSGPGNSGRNLPDNSPTGLTAQVPWLNGGVPQVDLSDPKNPVIVGSKFPIYPFIGQENDPTVVYDPGSMQTTIDCNALAPYELAPWVETTEPREVFAAGGGTEASLRGLLIRWAGADDMTRGSWRSPGFSTWYSGLVNGDGLLNSLWGSPAQSIHDPGSLSPYSAPFPPGPVPDCDPNEPNNWVIHMRGSGFRYYGGNFAHILAGDNYVSNAVYDYTDCPKNADGSDSDLCHPAPALGATTDTAGFPLSPTKNTLGKPTYQLGALHTYLDLSKYEGVSFWARRGPDGMGSLSVTIQDTHTSDDMNRQNETFCRRIYACHSKCQNYLGCTPAEQLLNENGQPNGNVYRCHGNIPLPGPSDAGSGTAASDLLDATFPRCEPPANVTDGHGACSFRTSYPDADFEGKQCKPYTFTSGESAEYCYNPGEDPPPPSREERCGDGYTNTLQLTTDWVFYTVPFSDMRQGGYGKISPELDLKSVYSVTLQWGAGDSDFYIDDVSFYRTKKL